MCSFNFLLTYLTSSSFFIIIYIHVSYLLEFFLWKEVSSCRHKTLHWLLSVHSSFSYVLLTAIYNTVINKYTIIRVNYLRYKNIKASSHSINVNVYKLWNNRKKLREDVTGFSTLMCCLYWLVLGMFIMNTLSSAQKRIYCFLLQYYEILYF